MVQGVRLFSRRQPVLAAVLVVALGVFVFADAVHSVHHLLDQRAASRCVVASASMHAPAAGAEVMSVEPPDTPVLDSTREVEPPRAAVRPVRPRQGRSPPTGAPATLHLLRVAA
jgi:hypothetical protein